MYLQRRIGAVAVLAGCVMLGVAAGCGKSQSSAGKPVPASEELASQAEMPAAQSGVELEGPAAAVRDWLEAVRTGNDEKATAMLTTLAREKTAAMNLSVRPPASETAKYEIGRVRMVGDDAAQVAATWTDLDEEGKPQTDEAIWVLRKEPQGWRIAGVAATVFPGEPPLKLNFEDPEDMLLKQQWLREEYRRRAEQTQQAQKPDQPEPPIRR